MKYINPGFGQLLQGSLSESNYCSTSDVNVSTTGYYIDLSANTLKNGYISIDSTKELWLSFDLYHNQVSTNMHNFLTFIDESDSNKQITFGYKYVGYYQTTFYIAITKDNFVNYIQLGELMNLNSKKINSFEIHIKNDTSIMIDVYIDNRLKQSISDANISFSSFNKINFHDFVQESQDVKMYLSHIIYQDTGRIGRERIKMLLTDDIDNTAQINSNSSYTFSITSDISDNSYHINDITGFGIVSSITNDDINVTSAEIKLDNVSIANYDASLSKEEYHSLYLEKDPLTNDKFINTNIKGRKIVVKTNYV